MEVRRNTVTSCTCTFMAIFILYLPSLSLADWVEWDYDLRSAPKGWEIDDEWVFELEGVRVSEYVSSPYGYLLADILTAELIVPGGCDSIVIHVEQDLHVSYGGESGGADVYLDYRLDGQDWVTLFHKWYEQTIEPLHYMISPPDGVHLEFRFRVTLSSGSEMHPGWAAINWLLYDLTLTLYGEGLSLEQCTWGAIKRFASS